MPGQLKTRALRSNMKHVRTKQILKAKAPTEELRGQNIQWKDSWTLREGLSKAHQGDGGSRLTGSRASAQGHLACSCSRSKATERGMWGHVLLHDEGTAREELEGWNMELGSGKGPRQGPGSSADLSSSTRQGARSTSSLPSRQRSPPPQACYLEPLEFFQLISNFSVCETPQFSLTVLLGYPVPDTLTIFVWF